MKKVFLCFLLALNFASCDKVNKILENLLGNDDIVAGLKEALRVGTDSAVVKLSAEGGYLRDEAVKILLPEEAQTTFKAIEALQTVSSNPLVGNLLGAAGLDMPADLEKTLETAFNRAAEDAAPKATNIFVNAITNMSIDDGKEILFSKDTVAATKYLKVNTETELTDAFSPVVSTSMDNVAVSGFTVTEAWTLFADQNNKLASIAARDDVQTALTLASITNSAGVANIRSTVNSVKPVSTNIGGYVTGKALDGLFTKVGAQEHKIRTDASARVNKLLQDVFGQLDNK
jgi:hypothetical protein